VRRRSWKYVSGGAGGSTSSLPFPWFNCYCGDIDLIGQPKAQWFYGG
jgi:hypothetical protein